MNEYTVSSEQTFDYCLNCGQTHAIGYDCGQDFEIDQESLFNQKHIPKMVKR